MEDLKITDEELDNDMIDIETAFTEVTQEKFFEDRTLIIKDFVINQTQWVVDNKPPRFGKTTNMYSMVLYLSKFVELKNPKLFKELKIGSENDFELKYFKKCAVFYLNLRVYKDKHAFDTVITAFKSCFDRVKQHYPEYDVKFDPENISISLTNLMRHVKGLSRFAFIDEYDSAFIELYHIYKTGTKDEKVKAKKLAEQIYAFFDRSCREYACKFLLTGIVCLEYGDFFSDPSMIFSQAFEVYNMPWHEYHLIPMNDFVNSKGFSPDSKPDAKWQAKLTEWYGGYKLIDFDEVIGDYLNLYSVSKCFSRREYTEYFSTSGCTKWLRKFFQREDVIIRVNEILLLKEITLELQSKPFLQPESSSGRKHILSLLVKCGYLTLVSKIDKITYRVKIPNEECRQVLIKLIEESFSRYLPPMETNEIRSNLCQALRSGNEDDLQTAIKQFFAAVQGSIKYEETYGLLFYNALQGFLEISIFPYDTPAGGGKCDGVVQIAEKGYVVEFKRCPSDDLPKPDRMEPDDYDIWCINKGKELLQNAENQHINQCYMEVLNSKPTITTKYRLLIACVQKRAFIKLTEVSN